jgi:hypothetical protein
LRLERPAGSRRPHHGAPPGGHLPDAGRLAAVSRPAHLALPEWPGLQWTDRWYGPDHFGTERARIESEMEQLPGQQLILVRYSALHNPLDEWVYNAADIDDSKVVWAREMDALIIGS